MNPRARTLKHGLAHGCIAFCRLSGWTRTGKGSRCGVKRSIRMTLESSHQPSQRLARPSARTSSPPPSLLRTRAHTSHSLYRGSGTVLSLPRTSTRTRTVFTAVVGPFSRAHTHTHTHTHTHIEGTRKTSTCTSHSEAFSSVDSRRFSLALALTGQRPKLLRSEVCSWKVTSFD
jgi:hypothetical protein